MDAKKIKSEMASCATPVMHVWCFMCITCVEKLYYTCICYTCNTPVFLLILYDIQLSFM